MRNPRRIKTTLVALAAACLWNLRCQGSNALQMFKVPAGLLQAIAIRGNGEQYGTVNDSTIPTDDEVAQTLGVRPVAKVPKIVWSASWKLQKRTLPLLHLRDPIKPQDLDLCLLCLWCKATSGCDVTSPVYDDLLTYDMLPRFSRIMVGRKLGRFVPRLLHANIELRTAFIDRAISTEVEAAINLNATGRRKIRLITFGAGYDVRSIRLGATNVIDDAYELDRPDVVEAKQKMLERLLLRRQRVQKPRSIAVQRNNLPKLMGVDLNDTSSVRAVLQEILRANANDSADDSWHTIFLFEGVMLYLEKGIPAELLRICSELLRDKQTISSSASLVFTDRLENVPGGNKEAARIELGNAGWNLNQWCPKPGLTRHMGTARPL